MTERNDHVERGDVELGESVRRSVARRVDDLDPSADAADLARRIDRAARGRRELTVLAVIVALLVGVVGAVAIAGDGGPEVSVAGSPFAAEGTLDGVRTELFTRDVDDLHIVVSRTTYEPVPECGLVSTLEAEIEGPGVSGVARLFQWQFEQSTQPLEVHAGVLDGDERGVGWVILELPMVPSGSTARAVFDGGPSDEMTLIDGVAVLVAPVERSDGMTYEFTVDVDGTPPGVRTAQGSGEASPMPTITPEEACAQVGPRPTDPDSSSETGEVTVPTVVPAPATPSTPTAPPATLPPPSPDGPADPDAARAEIVAMWTRLHTGTTSQEERQSLREDGEALAGVAAQAMAEREARVATMTVEVHDVVFVSPTRAAVSFNNVFPEGADIRQIGYAVLVDGRWLQSRESSCAGFARAGVHCPG